MQHLSTQEAKCNAGSPAKLLNLCCSSASRPACRAAKASSDVSSSLLLAEAPAAAAASDGTRTRSLSSGSASETPASTLRGLISMLKFHEPIQCIANWLCNHCSTVVHQLYCKHCLIVQSLKCKPSQDAIDNMCLQ